ncbi:MAG: adenylyltransferase/cytidyltransferase family protein [Candidatus Paceibacterota bacterium]|jgi:FAD synthetase
MKKERIMVFGTFDGLHKGHLNFFKQAKALVKNSFLIVSIARDKNVLKIKKKKPYLNERKRMLVLKKTLIADRVVLGNNRNYLLHILKEKPDIIALGYDQKHFTKNLKENLKKRGLDVKIVRLKPYKEHIYKNHLLNPFIHSK